MKPQTDPAGVREEILICEAPIQLSTLSTVTFGDGA
jgi:hypothetical protein